MKVRKIKKEELMEARNISSVAFEWAHDTEGKTPMEYFQEATLFPETKEEAYWYEKLAAFTHEGEMMSVLSLYPFKVHFDENIIKMGGLAGLSTYPHHRGKGAITNCIKAAFDEMYNEGQILSYLYGFNEIFYERLGFKRTNQSIRWTFDLDTIPNFKYEGSMHLYRDSDEDDLDSYENIYNKFSKGINLMVVRDEYDWGELKKANPFLNSTMSFVYKDINNIPKGYIIFSKDFDGETPVMNCSELVFDSFEGLRAIMSFVKTFRGDYEKISFKAPKHMLLEHFCTDYEMSSSKRVIRPNGMVRVIDVKSVLQKALYKGDGKIKITVIDNILSQNNKTFNVEFKNNRAVQIQENDYIQADNQGGGDIIMSINEFSAAIVGNYSVEHFEYKPDIRVLSNNEVLDKVFYQKKCWINNFF